MGSILAKLGEWYGRGVPRWHLHDVRAELSCWTDHVLFASKPSSTPNVKAPAVLTTAQDRLR